MNDKTGGPAFPTTQYNRGISPSGHSTGLTLRDYFAAKWMQGWMANPELDDDDWDVVAANAYKMADAMLKEREK